MRLEELLGLLCGLTIAVAVVTVVGHGLWKLFAALFRAAGGDSPAAPLPPIRSRRVCPVCGQLLGAVEDRCRNCGASVGAPEPPSPAADLAATRRQLTRWWAQGTITEEVYRQLLPLATGGAPSREVRAEPAAAAPAAPPLEPTSPFAAPPAPAAQPPAAAEIVAAEVVEKVREPAAPAPVRPTPARPAPWDIPEPPAAPARPTARQTLADMLQSFMEQRNIRWAELISGLLIVVSAVGLVISLRATLREKIPYFPALMFLLVTAGIHGAGIYSLRRWNLKTTSRAVLIIATLLVPLAFLASIWLSGSGIRAQPVTDTAYFLAVVIGLASFGTMNYFAARALLRHGWWRLMTVVLGTSAGQLLINRLEAVATGPIGAALLMLVPLGAFLVAVLALLQVSARRGHFGLRPAHQFFLEVGVGTFSLLAPIGLYLAKAEDLRDALGNLSPVLSLAATALLAAGLVAHRRLTGPQLAAYRTTGTAVAIGGAGLMLLMLAFAWPQLPLLIAVGLVDFVLLTLLARLAHLPVLHIPAVACLGVAHIGGFHICQGTGSETTASGLTLVQATLSGSCTAALTVFASLVAGAGGWLLRRWRDVGVSYLQAATGWAGVCLAIAAYTGFWAGPAAGGDWAAAVFCYFAAFALAGGWTLRRQDATVLGSALLLMACVQGLQFNDWLREHLDAVGLFPGRPVLVAFLSHSLATGALAVARKVTGEGSREVEESKGRKVGGAGGDEVLRALGWSSLVTSVCATPFALAVSQDRCGEHAVYVLCTATVWMGWALAARSAWALAVFQLLSTVSLSFATAAVCVRGDWWSGHVFDARHVYAQISVLAVWCAGWVVFRRLTGQQGRALAEPVAPERALAEPVARERALAEPVAPERALAEPVAPEPPARRPLLASLWPAAEPTVDQVLTGVLVAAVFVATFVGWLPGLSGELGLGEVLSAEGEASLRLFCASAGWWAVALMMLAVAAALWERRSLVALAGVVLLSAAPLLLLAARFADQQAAASALRWLAALFCTGWTVAACWWGGRSGTAGVRTGGGSGMSRPADVLRWLSLALGGGAVLALTTATLWQVASGHRLGGPAAGSWFAAMGPAVSYAVPLAVLVAVLLAYAVREATDGYLLAASLVFQYFVTLACALPVLTAGRSFDAAVWAMLLQANAAGLAAFTGLWAGLLPWVDPRRSATSAEVLDDAPLLSGQVVLLVAALVAIAMWIGGALFLDPQGNWPAVDVLGRWPSYVAIVLAGGGLLWLFRRSPEWAVLQVALFAMAVVAHVVAASVHARDTAMAWRGFHVLEVGWLMVATVAVGWACKFTWRRRRDPTAVALTTIRAVVAWGSAAIAVAVATAIRGGLSDPERPWWSSAVAALAVVLAGALAVRGRQQRFAYASVLLAGVAATLLWIGLRRPPLDSPVILIDWNAMAVLLLAGTWLVWEIVFQRRGEAGMAPESPVAPVHKVVSLGAIALAGLWFLLASLFVVLSHGSTRWPPTELITSAVALAILFLLLAGALWDRRATYSVFGLYVWGLAAADFILLQAELGHAVRTVAFLSVLAGYVAFTGYVWYTGASWADVGRRLGIFEPVEGLRRTARWLPVANLGLAAVVAVASASVVLSFAERELRVAAGCLPLLLAGGAAALAQQRRRAALQLLAILLVALAAVYLGWADLAPDWSARLWLDRTIRLLMACAGGAFVLGVVVARVLRPAHDWHPAVRRGAVVLGVSAIAVLLCVLALEAALFDRDEGAPIDAVQIAAVSVVLVALLVALLSLAVMPGRDPLQLSERGRMAYVYGAQIVAALLFAHIYLAKPTLFHGFLGPWWPYIVLAIAFGGVGVGAVFQRLGWRVLAEPFQKSGAFLPLVPALGMWVLNSESSYSMVLLTIGVLYMVLSFAHKSLVWGVAAALAGNGALWSLLAGTEDFTFAAHPQFWLIPPAVSALVAAQINRRRLSEPQLTAIRYAAMSLVYLSSSVEMLKIGIGESPWPPMILIGLAIAGVAFGIAMQVRAYLYMGTAFVLVSLVSMVAHASRSIHHSWPWWAFGIAMGGLILFVFGWFEGHREQMVRLVERLRHWEK
jgi:hypothetical protein